METKQQTFWEKIATFIVDKRNIFFLFFFGGMYILRDCLRMGADQQ